MSEIVYQSEYLTTEYDAGKSLFYTTWSPKTNHLENEGYREEVLHYTKLVEKFQPELFLNDARLFEVPIVPETQQWISENSVPIIHKYILKYAIVIPQEFIAQLSIDQTTDEAERVITEKSIIKQFTSILEAKIWLGVLGS